MKSNTKFFESVFAFLLAFLFAFSGCIMQSETEPYTEAITEIASQATEASGDETIPLALTRGDVRMLCPAKLNDFEKEIIKRFNATHEEQIRLVYAEEPSDYLPGDTPYWDAAIREDVDLYWISPPSDTAWVFGLHGLLMPLDKLMGDVLEKGDYWKPVLDACRYRNELMILPAFFEVRSTAVPRVLYEKDPEAFASLIRFRDFILSLPDQDFWFSSQSWLGNETGASIDYESLTCDFRGDFLLCRELLEIGKTYRATHDMPVPDGVLDSEKWDYVYRQSIMRCDSVGTALQILSRELFEYGPYGEKGGMILPFPGEKGSRLSVGYGAAVSQYAENLGTIKDFLSFLLSDEIMRMELDAPPLSLYTNPLYSRMPLSRYAFSELVEYRYNEAMPGKNNERLMEVNEMVEGITSYSPEGSRLYRAYIAAAQEIQTEAPASLEEIAACYEKHVIQYLGKYRDDIATKKAVMENKGR